MAALFERMVAGASQPRLGYLTTTRRSDVQTGIANLPQIDGRVPEIDAQNARRDKVSMVVTRAAERMREEIKRPVHTTNPIQAATRRATIARLVTGGMIVLRPNADRTGLTGDFEVDGTALLADVPAVYKLAPRAGVEPTTYRLGGGCSIH